MAQVTSAIQLPPPLKMSGSLANNWKTFKAMWNNYEIAANLNDKSTEVRTATFLTSIGMDGFQLYESLDFAEEGDRSKIDKVLERLDRHFVGEVNETFERFVDFAHEMSIKSLEDFVDFISIALFRKIQ